MDTWEEFFMRELHKKEIRVLVKKVAQDYREKTIYPPKDKILNAFCHTPYDKVRCVIVGQDPYHEPGQAMGLSFSVPEGVPLPPSLQNIFKEYCEDTWYSFPRCGDLTPWADHGVMLLNSVLSVERGRAFSCAYPEYSVLFNDVISFLNQKKEGIVFILWGASAQKCIPLIDQSRHKVLRSAHPSPLSAYRGFFHSKPFSKANEFLKENGEEPIRWRLD
jgi:uracil-DNA glycosylase